MGGSSRSRLARLERVANPAAIGQRVYAPPCRFCGAAWARQDPKVVGVRRVEPGQPVCARVEFGVEGYKPDPSACPRCGAAERDQVPGIRRRSEQSAKDELLAMLDLIRENRRKTDWIVERRPPPDDGNVTAIDPPTNGGPS
jgi:hypothetical protein